MFFWKISSITIRARQMACVGLTSCGLLTVFVTGCSESAAGATYHARAEAACDVYSRELKPAQTPTTFSSTLALLKRQSGQFGRLTATIRKLVPVASNQRLAAQLAEALRVARAAEGVVLHYLISLSPLRRIGMTAVGKVFVPRGVAEPLRKAFLNAQRAAAALHLDACAKAIS